MSTNKFIYSNKERLFLLAFFSHANIKRKSLLIIALYWIHCSIKPSMNKHEDQNDRKFSQNLYYARSNDGCRSLNCSIAVFH